MSDYQTAVDDVERLDVHPDLLTDALIPVYSANEVEDGGGYDDLVARRGGPEERDVLKAAGWADSTAELRDKALPLTENGAAIHHYYHEIGKTDGEAERQLNEAPKEFARQAYEWWYENGGEGASR
jgi:hypothetical protein